MPTPTDAELEAAMRENAAGPRRAQDDQGSIEMHPIPDQIALEKHNAGKAAVRSPSRGLRTTRLIPPGCT